MTDEYSEEIKKQILQSSIWLFSMASHESLTDCVSLLRESLRDVASFLQECSINPTQIAFPSQQKVIAAIAAFGVFTINFKGNADFLDGFSVTLKSYEDWKEQTLKILIQLLKISSAQSSVDSISFISHMVEANKQHTTPK